MAFLQRTADCLNKELLVDASLITGAFYFARATLSEQIGAEILLSYGFLKTGASRIKEGRAIQGPIMIATGLVIACHAVAMSYFVLLKNADPENPSNCKIQ